MEASAANYTIIGGKEGIIEHRKLCCPILAIRCITLLPHEQLEGSGKPVAIFSKGTRYNLRVSHKN